MTATTSPPTTSAQPPPPSQATAAAPPAQTAALAQRPAAPPPAPPAPDHGGAIDVFASASNFGVAQRMAMGLASSTMVPEAYRAKTFDPKGAPTDTVALGNCMIAIELASRIGASVFAVMQNLDVIHGRPGFRSSFLIATVNSCGRFTSLRWRFEGKMGEDTWGARAVAKDRETGEECIGTLVTIGMAKAEGWYQRNGSKWKTLPEQMLCYRSAAFWTRLFAPELSLGMSTSDEVADMTGATLTEMPAGLTQASAKMLEQELLGTASPVEKPATPAAPHAGSISGTARIGMGAAVGGAPAAQPEPEAVATAATEPAPAEKPAAKSTKAEKAKANESLPKGDLLPSTDPPTPAKTSRLTAEQKAAGWEESPDGELVPPPKPERQPGEEG